MSSGGDSTAALSPDGSLAANKHGKFGYGVGISTGGILVLLTAIALMSYFCTRYAAAAANAEADPEGGLDEATLKSWPRVSYSEAKRRGLRAGGGRCSVCLADYQESELQLRLLPECGHLFHARCVDPWLRMRPTCPVCRASPMQSPLTTPLAEVAPLAISR